MTDFGVDVGGGVDLRHLLRHIHSKERIKKTGLAGLAKTFLGINMDKDWRIRASDWESQFLSPRQIDYAANDALVGINIGLALALEVAGHRISLEDGEDGRVAASEH